MVTGAGPSKPRTKPRRLLIAVYVGFALVGFAAGASGRSPLHLVPSSHPLTPLARVGFVLEKQSLPKDSASFDALAKDLDAATRTFTDADRGAFELVVAVRGLRSKGEPDWKRAAELCRKLGWSRCDQAALEELARRSRP